MAHVAGTGGAGSSGSGYDVLKTGFSIATWREQQEEEKRKQQQALRESQQRARLENIERQIVERQKELVPTSDINASSQWFQRRAKEEKEKKLAPLTGVKENLRTDPIMQYQRLARTMGKEKLSERLATITEMWEAQNAPYRGGDVIWQLTSSNYTLDEVKNMISESHKVLFDPINRTPERHVTIENLRHDLQKTYKLDDPQWSAFEELFRMQEEAEIPTGWEQDPLGTILMFSLFVPGLQGVGVAGKLLAGAAKVPKVMGKVKLAWEAISVPIAIEEENRLDAIASKVAQAEGKLKEATDPVLSRSGLATMHKLEGDDPFAKGRELREALAEWSREPESRDDIIAMQKYFQENGVATDLPADGILDLAWQGQIMDVYEQALRENFETQRQAIEDGDAPYWATVDGDVTSDEWVEWLANRETRLAELAAKQAENPDRYAFWEQTGIPTTKLGLDAFGRKLEKDGFFQAIYGSLLKGAEIAGGLWRAPGCAVNLWARQQDDPDYQKATKNLTEYVDGKVIDTGDTFKKQPEESNETFARWAVQVGPLKDDPQAQKLLDALDSRQVQLIDERYAPDYLLTLGHLTNMDYNEVRQFGLDHPDIVRAFTTGVDLATVVANPIGRARRATFKPKVKPTAKDFEASARAQTMTKRVTDYLAAKDFGRATHYVKGTSAAEILSKLWTPTGKKSDRVSPKAKIIRDLASEIVDAVDSGNPSRVAKILDGAPDAVIDSMVNTARGTNKTKKLGREDIRGWVGSVAEREIMVDRVAGAIAKRQNKIGDAVSKGVLYERLSKGLAKEWGKGADIFPYLRDNRLSPPNRPLAFISKAISEVKNDWVREFLTKAIPGTLVRAPTSEIELHGLNTLDRIYDAAIAISQDVAWAWDFRNRWAAAKSESQLKRLVNELDTAYTKKFSSAGRKELGYRERIQSYFRESGEIGGQALAPDPLAYTGRPQNQRLLTEYGTGSKTKQAVPDTSYQQYMASLHRAALWAPYNLEGASSLGKAVLGAKNVYRAGIWTAHTISTPLRQWTVAMGAPLLFQKHAFTDSFRTVMEENPFSLAEAAGLKGLSIKGKTLVPKIRSSLTKRMDKVMEQIPDTLRDEILYQRARVHASEAQWLSGTRREVYRPKSIRDKDGNVTDLQGAADALRRVAMGKAFKEYARGGTEGVRAWLGTKDGKKFMMEGGWYARAKELMEANGLETKGKSAEIRRRAVEEYMDTVVRQEFDVMFGSNAIPNIGPALKRMALNDEVLGVDAIKKLILDNPHDNVTLSIRAKEGWNPSDMPGYIVGKAMAANKWNRDVVFDHTFLREYNKMVKEGAEKAQAARTAATIAELNTSRIHFDLSNALAIEARHRWFAWFATKHRLYGTYMVKLAAERPMIAGAALQIKDWMEERNERMGVSNRYDKFDLVVNIGDGNQIRLNLAPIMWLSEYPLESSAAILLEKGAAWAADRTLGWDLHPSPTPFGMSITRADALIITLADVIGSGEIEDDDALQAWLETLPGDRQTRWTRLINNQRSVAIAQGKEITVLEAFNKAKAAAWTNEMWQAFKFYSGRLLTSNETLQGIGFGQPVEKIEIEKLLEEFSTLSESDPEAAQQMLRENRVLAASINSSLDPVEKAELDEGFRIYNQLLADYQAKLETASDRGSLPIEYAQLNQDFRDKVEKMTSPMYKDYNESFAKYYGDHNPQEFIDALGVLLPLVPAESVWAEGRAKTDLEKREYQKEYLEPVFQEQLDNFGISDTDHSTPLYHILRDYYIDEPLAAWSGESEYTLTPRTAQSVARYLARGGESGVYKADAFLEVVQDKTRRELLGRGIVNGKSSTPLMALLSPEEKDLIFYNTNPETRTEWYKWAMADWAVKKYRKENGLGTSSNAYKDLRAQVDAYTEQLAAANPDFAEELAFSKLRMHERLLAYGVGQGTDAESKSWAKFLTLTQDYWNELDTYQYSKSKTGIGPTAQSAFPITHKYLPQIAELAKENPVWWSRFRSSFSLSKFGYSWWSPDDVDDFLYSGQWRTLTDEEIAAAEAEEEEWW